MKEVVETLEYPGDAHHDEQFAVEDQLLLDVAVDPVGVVAVLRGDNLLSSVSGVPSFLGCQIGSTNEVFPIYGSSREQDLNSLGNKGEKQQDGRLMTSIKNFPMKGVSRYLITRHVY